MATLQELIERGELEGYEPGTPHFPNALIDGVGIDRGVAEDNPCGACGGACEFHPYTDGTSYRAFAVCTRCGNAVEF